MLFCQAFFNRFLVFFSVFLKNIKKRAKSQANGERESRICGDFSAEYRKKGAQKHRRPFGRGCVRPMSPCLCGRLSVYAAFGFNNRT